MSLFALFFVALRSFFFVALCSFVLGIFFNTRAFLKKILNSQFSILNSLSALPALSALKAPSKSRVTFLLPVRWGVGALGSLVSLVSLGNNFQFSIFHFQF